MTTDFRALCVELATDLALWMNYDDTQSDLSMPDIEANTHALIDRARTALAEPELEGPTVMEIIELADEVEAAGLGQVDLVRKALSLWGRPS